MSGKGSTRRPTQISDEEAAENWARIFSSSRGGPQIDTLEVLLEEHKAVDELIDKKTKQAMNRSE